MRFNKLIRWILTVTCIIVCLLGVSYASYSDNFSIVHSITTSSMKYSLKIDGNKMNVSLSPEDSKELLNLKKGGTYSLAYSVMQDNNSSNIQLKSIKNEYIGSITINLNNVTCTQDGVTIETPSYLKKYIPDSLGSFDCYHNFNGMMGTIKLVKTSKTFKIDSTNDNDKLIDNILKQDDLTIPEELQTDSDKLTETNKQVTDEPEGKEDVSVTFDIKDGTSNENISEDANKEIQTTEQNKKPDKEKKVKKVKVSILIEATYDFEIPLNFDQFNKEN